MNIFFNINHLGLGGLGATLISLIRNCSNPGALSLYFLCSELSSHHKNNIDKLLEYEKFAGKIKYIDFNAREIFGYLNPFLGNWTTYGKLLASDYIEVDKALYLDADLIIAMDILHLNDFDFKGNFLAAVPGSEVRYALENSLFIEKLGCKPDMHYFNAGIIYFDFKKWRELDINHKWKDFIKKQSDQLLMADQTVLNGICKGGFAHLPSIFNNPWYPKKPEPRNASKSILHFVGSPKPWDMFGSLIHPGYETWNKYDTQFWKSKYSKLSIDKLTRIWSIKRSIIGFFLK